MTAKKPGDVPPVYRKTCGTEIGCRQHWVRGEWLCGDCDAYFLETRGRLYGEPKKKLPKHGTPEGVRHHLYLGEPLCRQCEYEREMEVRVQAAKDLL